MTTRVHVAEPATPFKVIVRLIHENKVGAIPIVDRQGIPVGVVSKADLPPRSRIGQAKANAANLVAHEIMTSPPSTIAAQATVTEAARIMRDRKVNRLIVVDERGRIAGVVSLGDLRQGFAGRPSP